MQPVTHNNELYTGEAGTGKEASGAARNIARMAELLAHSSPAPTPTSVQPKRNTFTRTVDAVFATTRKYAPPIHWIGVVMSAVGLFLYAHILALTVRVWTTGIRSLPNMPVPCVMAVWHGCAPSLLVAIAACRPRSPVAIMISRDSRGDCLALLCRMLGLSVVRGDSESRGWEALAQLAQKIERGSCALITADGGGPSLVAKAGAIVLSSATCAPLVAIGADCCPAISEPHKWDAARNPVPFGQIVITIGQPRTLPLFADLLSIEEARGWLQDALDKATTTAKDALRLTEWLDGE